jgi:hypothetical protein
MAHELVKITVNDDGEYSFDEHFHYVHAPDGAARTLCSNEVFGDGEGQAQFMLKEVKRGGISCPKCMEIIKAFKRIKL